MILCLLFIDFCRVNKNFSAYFDQSDPLNSRQKVSHNNPNVNPFSNPNQKKNSGRIYILDINLTILETQDKKTPDQFKKLLYRLSWTFL